jgi:5-formyltetrahydrofolate cyclo-ligase
MAGPSASFFQSRLISTDPDTDARKASFRAKLKQRRAEAAAANGAAIAQLAAERFLAAIPVKAGQVVAGYWPMGDELDPRPLLQQLQRRGALIVLPVIQTGSRLLLFRLCKDLSQVPPAGAYGIPAPPEGSSPLQPDVLLVPLVGFDREGHRLGMGGGYYDTTAAHQGGGRKIAAGRGLCLRGTAGGGTAPRRRRRDAGLGGDRTRRGRIRSEC